MKSKFISLSASIAMILFLLFVLLATLTATAQYASPTIKETRITTSGTAWSPAIYDNK